MDVSSSFEVVFAPYSFDVDLTSSQLHGYLPDILNSIYTTDIQPLL